MKTEFISVEIAIKTDFESDAFVKWFEAQDNYVAKLECAPHKWYIYFAPIPSRDANTTIRKLCEMIRELPSDVRQDWDRAGHREFFAGYHVGGDPFCFTEHLDVETLEAAAELKAGIGYALYPAPPNDLDE
ncbi:MAG: hypothetical protein KDK99_08825 [Verrucomicrobiales bacterium]|nr:hypothetical protein [Verrucomicrobiales bacterium]